MWVEVPTDGAMLLAVCLRRNRASLLFLASEDMRTGAAPVSYLFRWPRRLVDARREAFLVVDVYVCFRRGSSQDEAVSVRDKFNVEISLIIGCLDDDIVDYSSPLFRRPRTVCGQ